MVEVRAYTDADYKAVKRNLEEGDLFNADIDTQERLHRKIIERPGSILVASVGDEVVGSAYLLEDPWNSFIFRLAVRKDFRRHGIGALLMDEAEKKLREKGANNVSLFVRENHSELQEWYKKRGYARLPILHQGMHKDI